MIDSWGISYEIAQRQISVEPTDDRSTLVQVIACCHQQQAVIRANVNTDLCHHMASLGHNVLKLKIILEDHFIILCINHWLSWYTDYKQPLSHAIECGRFWSQIMDCGRKKILDALILTWIFLSNTASWFWHTHPHLSWKPTAEPGTAGKQIKNLLLVY